MFSSRLITAEETRPLRFEVLWPHKPDVKSCVIDIDHRSDAMHVGAFRENQLVGICSLFEMHTPKLPDQKQYRLRAMATAPEVRGSGAGKVVVDEALKQVAAKGADVLWCDARKVALGFYDRMGFSVIDQWYEVPLIGPHKLMYYRFL